MAETIIGEEQVLDAVTVSKSATYSNLINERTRPDGWEDAIEDGIFYAYLVVGDTTYTDISAPKISAQTSPSALSVGNVCCKSLQVSVLTEDTFDTTVPIEVYAQATTDNETLTEAMPFGVFYIDTQTRDCLSNLVSLTCYDSLLKADVALFDEDGECAQTEAVVAAAEKLGVEIGSSTYSALHAEYTASYTSSDTAKSILGYIAACHGGNWFLSGQNLLTLQIYEANPTSYTNPTTHAILGGLSISWSAYVSGLTATGSSSGEAESAYSYSETESSEDVVVGALIGSAIIDESIIGNTTRDVEKLATFDLGTIPYMTDDIFENLCNQIIGYTYTGFDATSCVIDPATEPGDRTSIEGYIDSPTDIINVTTTLNLAARCDIGTPDIESLQSEYPYIN